MRIRHVVLKPIPQKPDLDEIAYLDAEFTKEFDHAMPFVMRGRTPPPIQPPKPVINTEPRSLDDDWEPREF